MPSLYANLLDPNATKKATISGAPVKYEFKSQAEAPQEEKKPTDASLRFQPIKRPQVAQKPRPRPVVSASPVSYDKPPTERKPPAASATTTSSIEKWTKEDEYDEDPYAAEYLRRQDEERRKARMANRKRKKKNKEVERLMDFDQIYDPEYPIRLDEYKGSEEQANAEYEWKQLLHAHQLRKRKPSPGSSDDEHAARKPNRAFAPPANYNFAPPSFDADKPASVAIQFEDDDEYEPPPPPPPVIEVPKDATGDDAYLRRTHMSPPSFTPAPETSSSAQPPPAPKPGVISAAPVRYEKPVLEVSQNEEAAEDHGGLGLGASTQDDQMMDEPPDDEEAPRSNRPGQKGFAKRLLQKYGWQEGQGLGATGSGITTILRHQTEKRKKRPDAEGGGWATPGAMGRIVGGKKRKVEGEDSEDQQWSIVARLDGMLEGLDVEKEMSDGNLMQDIGDRVGAYGIVERLFIDRSKSGNEPVFVKFTSALSAFRAIQASNEKDFLENGRTVKSGFFDADKFEQGVYE